MLNKEWIKFLKLSNQKWWITIQRFIESEYQKCKLCPNKENIFRMFNILPPYSINVIMMFQDPYPQLRKGDCISNGIGLAAPYTTHSLKHFIEAIGIIGEFDNTFTHLITQGVFSINKYLTVEFNKPLSHSEYNKSFNGELLRWDLFSLNFLKRMNEEYNNMVYILFGTESCKLGYIINKEYNLIIETSHPSNRGYKHGLMDSNFAQKTNEYLKNNNKKEIKWKLDIK